MYTLQCITCSNCEANVLFLFQTHTAISRELEGMQLELDVELDIMEIERAYLAFEAMVKHEYGFFCHICGHHPSILVYDVTKKAVFSYDGM